MSAIDAGIPATFYKNLPGSGVRSPAIRTRSGYGRRREPEDTGMGGALLTPATFSPTPAPRKPSPSTATPNTGPFTIPATPPAVSALTPQGRAIRNNAQKARDRAAFAAASPVMLPDPNNSKPPEPKGWWDRLSSAMLAPIGMLQAEPQAPLIPHHPGSGPGQIEYAGSKPLRQGDFEIEPGKFRRDTAPIAPRPYTPQELAAKKSYVEKNLAEADELTDAALGPATVINRNLARSADNRANAAAERQQRRDEFEIERLGPVQIAQEASKARLANANADLTTARALAVPMTVEMEDKRLTQAQERQQQNDAAANKLKESQAAVNQRRATEPDSKGEAKLPDLITLYKSMVDAGETDRARGVLDQIDARVGRSGRNDGRTGGTSGAAYIGDYLDGEGEGNSSVPGQQLPTTRPTAKVMDSNTAKAILDRAGGDKERAVELALEMGFDPYTVE